MFADRKSLMVLFFVFFCFCSFTIDLIEICLRGSGICNRLSNFSWSFCSGLRLVGFFSLCHILLVASSVFDLLDSCYDIDVIKDRMSIRLYPSPIEHDIGGLRVGEAREIRAGRDRLQFAMAGSRLALHSSSQRQYKVPYCKSTDRQLPWPAQLPSPRWCGQ